MPRYNATITLRTVIEAASLDEAYTKARTRSVLDTIDEQETEIEEADQVECKFCGQMVPASTANWHAGSWVGDECCWDERLRSTA
jgi:hypothetical protein